MPHNEPLMPSSLQLNHVPQHLPAQVLKKIRRKAKLGEMIDTTLDLNGWKGKRKKRRKLHIVMKDKILDHHSPFHSEDRVTEFVTEHLAPRPL